MINDKKYFYFLHFQLRVRDQTWKWKMIRNLSILSHFQLRVRGQCKIRCLQFTSVMLCTAPIRACPTTLIFFFTHCHMSEKNLGHVSEKVLSQSKPKMLSWLHLWNESWPAIFKKNPKYITFHWIAPSPLAQKSDKFKTSSCKEKDKILVSILTAP